MKTCTRCGETKPFEDFHLNTNMVSGRMNQCKTCTREAMRQRRLDGKTQESERAGYRKNVATAIQTSRSYVLANAERVRLTRHGSNAIHRAIQRGQIIRPDTCEECGRSGCQIEAAHFNYAEPLRVRWLCGSCHRRWDAAQPKTKLPIWEEDDAAGTV